MPGLGTLINVAAIVVGGLLGLLLRSRLSDELQQNLVRVVALCTLFIGIQGTLEQAIVLSEGAVKMQGTMMAMGSLIAGTLIGSWLGIEKAIVRLGEWLKAKSGSGGDRQFVTAFVTTSLTVCIGAMAVVGSIRDGIDHDYSVLAAKAILDAVFVMAFSASLGRGCIFSAVPVAVFQGTMTLLAALIAPFLTPAALGNISLVGSMMIFCVGVNIIWGTKFKVADMLPALVIAAAWAAF
jgi:uncharacterized membrane protein, possible Na+ channel or pump